MRKITFSLLADMLQLPLELWTEEILYPLPRGAQESDKSENPVGSQTEQVKEKKIGSQVLKPFLFIQELLGQHLQYIKYFPQTREFYVYNVDAGLWECFGERTFLKLVQQMVGATPIARRQPVSLYAKGVYEELSGTSVLEHGVPNLDMEHLCLMNGLIENVSGKFKPFNSQVFVLHRTHYAFDPKATCPKFNKFLGEFCSGHEDRIRLLQA